MAPSHNARVFCRLSLLGVSTAFAVLATLAFVGASAEESAPSDYHERDAPRIAFADACLKLAESELAEASDLNRRVKNSVSEFDVQRLRLHVDLAKKNLSDAERGVDYSQSITGYMELRAQLAELDLKTAQDLQRDHPSSVTDAQLEKLRRYAEVCRLRVAMSDDPISALSIIDHLHWETHRLSEEVFQLNRRLERLERKTTLR